MKEAQVYLDITPFRNARKNVLCEVNSRRTEKYGKRWNTLKKKKVKAERGLNYQV